MASPALERSGLGRWRLKNMQGNENSKAAFVKEVFDCARLEGAKVARRLLLQEGEITRVNPTGAHEVLEQLGHEF